MGERASLKTLSLSVNITDQFLREIFFKEVPSFFPGGDSPRNPSLDPALKVVFPLGNRGVLRSQEGEGFRKERDSGEGAKERKKGRTQKWSDKDHK